MDSRSSAQEMSPVRDGARRHPPARAVFRRKSRRPRPLIRRDLLWSLPVLATLCRTFNHSVRGTEALDQAGLDELVSALEDSYSVTLMARRTGWAFTTQAVEIRGGGHRIPKRACGRSSDINR